MMNQQWIRQIVANEEFSFRFFFSVFCNLASSTSFHFGQLVWAKLGAAPFWPAVIFTEENQDWIRQKGEKILRRRKTF